MVLQRGLAIAPPHPATRARHRPPPRVSPSTPPLPSLSSGYSVGLPFQHFFYFFFFGNRFFFLVSIRYFFSKSRNFRARRVVVSV
jgi:hypothetical protein